MTASSVDPKSFAMAAVRPRIVHVLPGLGLGGAERILLTWLQHSAACFDNEVWALRGGALEASMRTTGARVYLAADKQACGERVGRFFIDRLRRRARQPCRLDCPTAVMGWLHHGNALALALQRARWPSARLLFSHHGGPDAPRGPWHRQLAQQVERSAHAIAHAHLYIAASSARAAFAQGLSLRPAWRLPAGIDTEAFGPNPQARAALFTALELAPSARLTGLIGRYDPAKDHALGLRAFLLGASTQDHLLLVGAGLHPLPPALAAMCTAAQRARVHTLVADAKQMPALLAGLDALLLSSCSEALPLVILEAMACALPVAATKVGDVAEALRGTGFVAPWNDAPALAHALQRALACGRAAATNPRHPAAMRLRRGREWVAREHGTRALTALLGGLLHQQSGPGSPPSPPACARTKDCDNVLALCPPR